MDRRQTLPSEVLLLIAEHAVLREAQDPLHLGWAASLCSACKSFRRVVTPILYAHVVVTRDNLEQLALLAREAPATLAWTRSATFLVIGRRLSIEPLIRAMTRLTAFAGRDLICDYIEEDLTISSIFLTGIGDEVVSRRTQKATRLHILVMVYDPAVELPEGELSLEYLMIDVLADDKSAWGLDIRRFFQHVDRILDRDTLPSLRRILLRPRCIFSGLKAEGFYIAVEEWGKTQRDSRIWIHDIAGPSLMHEGADVSGTLHLQDALAGDELWLTGRQLCPPSVPVPVANEQ
ncbi:hypothetical protein EXIGLDRAFT_832465 [Exidia glandulosa HHB12029]|uniref:Uncharacterized protein n=1 Tax=Exidia glandulosa HHB12029 TaxID=1314781 RepID=A0A165LLL4_EXIGL|nr:hypothetical protein EXIGLDRAFT_832465 [Exidia glandulosa HHB12029]